MKLLKLLSLFFPVSAGGNGPKVLSSPSSPSSQCSNGCRTLANLSKLSRRLGLGRLFRTLRIQGHTPIQVRRKSGSVLTKPRPTPNQIRATTQDHWEIHSPHHIFTSSDEKVSLPSFFTRTNSYKFYFNATELLLNSFLN